MDGSASEWITFEPCGRVPLDHELPADGRAAYDVAPDIGPVPIRRRQIIGFWQVGVPRETLACSYVMLCADPWPLVIGDPMTLLCTVAPDDPQCDKR